MGIAEIVGLLSNFGALIGLLAIIAIVLYLAPIPLWIAAWASGAYVGLMTLIAMRLRRVPPGTVVTARISAVKAGIEISINDLEAHFLAGGNVVRVVNAMISADKANIPLPFKRAAAIDLAGRNVLEAVQMSVIPKVITTPKIAAVAKDGIQLIAVARVTVRTNIDRLVGAAGSFSGRSSAPAARSRRSIRPRTDRPMDTPRAMIRSTRTRADCADRWLSMARASSRRNRLFSSLFVQALGLQLTPALREHTERRPHFALDRAGALEMLIDSNSGRVEKAP